VFFSERSLIECTDQVAPRSSGYCARACLRRPPAAAEGRADRGLEDREQTLFRATAFGDDVDRPLMKSDGSYTYFASDIAYHKIQVRPRFADMIDVWGADHGGYIKRMQAAVKAVSEGKAALDVKIVSWCGSCARASRRRCRSARAISSPLREVVDEVGRDAVRFMMLYRKNDAVLDFDLARVIEQSRENPVCSTSSTATPGALDLRNAREVLADLPEEPRPASATSPIRRSNCSTTRWNSP